MEKHPWLTKSQSKPPVSWDGRTRTFSIVLDGLKDIEGGIEAQWSPLITYVVRIRKVGTTEWSVGFETPLTGCGFVDLQPDTEYEMEVRSKNAHGRSGPVSIKVRTNPEGSLGV